MFAELSSRNNLLLPSLLLLASVFEESCKYWLQLEWQLQLHWNLIYLKPLNKYFGCWFWNGNEDLPPNGKYLLSMKRKCLGSAVPSGHSCSNETGKILHSGTWIGFLKFSATYLFKSAVKMLQFFLRQLSGSSEWLEVLVGSLWSLVWKLAIVGHAFKLSLSSIAPISSISSIPALSALGSLSLLFMGLFFSPRKCSFLHPLNDHLI